MHFPSIKTTEKLELEPGTRFSIKELINPNLDTKGLIARSSEVDEEIKNWHEEGEKDAISPFPKKGSRFYYRTEDGGWGNINTIEELSHLTDEAGQKKVVIMDVRGQIFYLTTY